MLTEKEKQWLIRLAKFLDENEEYDFREKQSPKSGHVRLVLSFPFAAKVKDHLDKDRKNFDYRVDAIFNKKLYEAIYLGTAVRYTWILSPPPSGDCEPARTNSSHQLER